MLGLSVTTRILLFTGATDMRKGFDGLSSCVFRRIRSTVPGTFDHRSEGSDQVRSGATRAGSGSGRGSGVGLGFETFLAAQGGAAERQDVSVVHEPVADGVGDSRIAEGFVPTFRRQLRGDDG
jgi:hypothetical protein